MTPPDPYPFVTSPPALGPLLARLRLARGWSQLRVAEQLCAASGVPTISRHEVSRWERQQRIPGDFWLGWLAVVLGAPGELLAAAAAHSRRLGAVPAAVGQAGSRSRVALLTLAHRWAADPSGAALGGPLAGRALFGPGAWGRGAPAGVSTGAAPAGDRRTGDPDVFAQVDPAAGADATEPDVDDLAELRRWDDLLGGADLAGHGAHRLRRAARAYRCRCWPSRRSSPAGSPPTPGTGPAAWTPTGWRCARRWRAVTGPSPGTSSGRPATC
jgi:transcriptional regulator with XRE-family HTH domain